MAYREPRPEARRAVLVSCSLERQVVDKMQTLAQARGVSLARVMREELVKAFAPEQREGERPE